MVLVPVPGTRYQVVSDDRPQGASIFGTTMLPGSMLAVSSLSLKFVTEPNFSPIRIHALLLLLCYESVLEEIV